MAISLLLISQQTPSRGPLITKSTIGAPLTTNQQTFRLDQTLGRSGQIFGRGTYSNYKNSFLNGSDNLTLGFLTQFEEQRNWEVSHTINLGAANVNNFRFGYLHATAPQGGSGPSPAVVSQLGINGIFQKFGPLQLTWSNLGINKFAGNGGAGNAYTGSEQPAWEYGDSFTTVRGRHTIGIGIDYRRWRLIRNLADDFLGDYSFNAATVLTNQINCPTVTCGTGNATADFLLGYYSGASTYQPGPLSPTDTAGNPQTHIFSYLAPYFEDDTKFNSRLSLNLGLRYDYRAGPTRSTITSSGGMSTTRRAACASPTRRCSPMAWLLWGTVFTNTAVIMCLMKGPRHRLPRVLVSPIAYLGRRQSSAVAMASFGIPPKGARSMTQGIFTPTVFVRTSLDWQSGPPKRQNASSPVMERSAESIRSR